MRAVEGVWSIPQSKTVVQQGVFRVVLSLHPTIFSVVAVKQQHLRRPRRRPGADDSARPALARRVDAVYPQRYWCFGREVLDQQGRLAERLALVESLTKSSSMVVEFTRRATSSVGGAASSGAPGLRYSDIPLYSP